MRPSLTDFHVGDSVEITARPFEGPPIGTICKVVSISNASVHVVDKMTRTGWYGKMPDNIRLVDRVLMLDEGL